MSGASIADVLRLLSSGASGAIVMALGDGPLRTKQLTSRLPSYAPRTIYRYSGRLVQLGIAERHEEPGVPSKVVHRLTDGCGTELFGLLDSFAGNLLTQLPSGEIDAHAWAMLGLLAELWESGMVAELSAEGRSPTELARVRSDLSYHQVNRRANLFTASGLLEETPGVGRRRRYVLAAKARRAMALVAGIGRWRERHMLEAGDPGLDAGETATVLRAALPLVRLEDCAGAQLELCVGARGETNGAEERLWIRIGSDGMLEGFAGNGDLPDAWARGRSQAWLTAVLDDQRSRLERGGNEALIDACLARLYRAVWGPV